jgi:hypothetical protein
MKHIKTFKSFINENKLHEGYLSWNSPELARFEKKIITPELGEFVKVVRTITPENLFLNKKAKYIDSVSNWKNIYRSTTTGDYADISPNGKVIKAAVNFNGEMIDLIYVNSAYDTWGDKPPVHMKTQYAKETTSTLSYWEQEFKDFGAITARLVYNPKWDAKLKNYKTALKTGIQEWNKQTKSTLNDDMLLKLENLSKEFFDLSKYITTNIIILMAEEIYKYNKQYNLD